jgi:hypothetical protein
MSMARGCYYCSIISNSRGGLIYHQQLPWRTLLSPPSPSPSSVHACMHVRRSTQVDWCDAMVKPLTARCVHTLCKVENKPININRIVNMNHSHPRSRMFRVAIDTLIPCRCAWVHVAMVVVTICVIQATWLALAHKHTRALFHKCAQLYYNCILTSRILFCIICEQYFCSPPCRTNFIFLSTCKHDKTKYTTNFALFWE